MTIVLVVRVGPTRLRPGRARARLDELTRIFATPVEIEEVATITALADALAIRPVAAIAADAPPPGQLNDVVDLAGAVPVLHPRWHTRRTPHGDSIQHFAGYAQLVANELVDLADGQLARTQH
jgi:hypothetical protein